MKVFAPLPVELQAYDMEVELGRCHVSQLLVGDAKTGRVELKGHLFKFTVKFSSKLPYRSEL